MNIIYERCSADRSLLFDTILAEIESVVLKRVGSVCQDGPHKYSPPYNFCVTSFHSELPNTILENQVAFHQYKNVNIDIEPRNMAGRFSEI